LASALIWPSRSETRAISEAEKNPPMHTMTRTTMMSRTTLLIFIACPNGLPLAPGACVVWPSLDRITYGSRGHGFKLVGVEVQRPAGGRARDHLFRRDARSGPRAGRCPRAAPAAPACPAGADRISGAGDPLGRAGGGVGGDRGRPPGPHLP